MVELSVMVDDRTVSDGTALALVDVSGVFTSEIGFRTPKIRRSDVL